MTATAVSGEHCLAPVYARRDVTFVRGEGCELIDETGRRFLDFTSGIGVNALGYGHPALAAAIAEATSSGLLHISNLYRHHAGEELAALLTTGNPGARVFFANSGAEAVEGAIKFARRAAALGKHEVVALRGSFHGRTYGALSVTDRSDYQRPFLPLVPGMRFIEPDNVQQVTNAVQRDRTAAVIVEPVQGEGGVRPVSPQFLRVLRDRCDRADCALIFDEIQCGLGRTGTRFAHEHAGVEPDILVLAKPLGGGLPMSAVIVSQRIASTLRPGDHGSTFGGGPFVSSVALACVRTIFQPDFLRAVRDRGQMLAGRLRTWKHKPGVVEIRGMGLMWGVEMAAPVAPTIQRAFEAGLLVLQAGPNVLRLLPPLVISDGEIARGLGILEDVL